MGKRKMFGCSDKDKNIVLYHEGALLDWSDVMGIRLEKHLGEGGGGALPYMGYMYGPKVYHGFSTVLVINRVLIFAL